MSPRCSEVTARVPARPDRRQPLLGGPDELRQRDAGGDGDVQGVDGVCDGDPESHVGYLARAVGQTGALAPKQECEA